MFLTKPTGTRGFWVWAASSLLDVSIQRIRRRRHSLPKPKIPAVAAAMGSGIGSKPESALKAAGPMLGVPLPSSAIDVVSSLSLPIGHGVSSSLARFHRVPGFASSDYVG